MSVGSNAFLPRFPSTSTKNANNKYSCTQQRKLTGPAVGTCCGRYRFSATTYARMNAGQAVASFGRQWRQFRRGSLVQLDGERSFCSMAFEAWLKKRGIKKVPIPARCPEAAICENAWADITRRVDRKAARTRRWRHGVKKTVRNMRDWKSLVLSCCRATSPKLLKRLVRSMPGRVQKLRIAKNLKY